MKIYAPVKDFNGLRNNVRFVNGVGETDNQSTIEWFQSHGYEVEDESHFLIIDNLLTNKDNSIIDIETDEVEDIDNVLEELLDDVPESDDLDSMTPNQLREWARANGFGREIKNIRSKEKLLSIIRG